MRNVLCIGGSDPSSGAGIQGDVRTVSSLGLHCLTAVTAVTFQNTSGYAGAEPLRPKWVRRQIESALSDFEIGAVKIGMVYSSGVISAVAKSLSGVRAPVVADPVVRSSTGGALIKKGASAKYAKKILPLARVATPNLAEAEHFAGVDSSADGVRAAAAAIAEMGARSVVVTGVRRGRRVTDYLLDGGRWSSFGSPALEAEAHGSGCAFSASMAAFLAGGDGLRESLLKARRHARAALAGAARAGRGMPTVSSDPLRAQLAAAVGQFCSPQMGELIPECRTNFAFAKEGARSRADVLAVDGRITQTSRGPSAGRLAYGASGHVCAALLEAARRFPQIRSAANIRFDAQIAARMEAAGLSALYYDRSAEPEGSKKSGSSVRWGVRSALEGASAPPDAVCHSGDMGKEPMAVVFGEDPASVVAKLRRLQANPNMPVPGEAGPCSP